MNRMTSHVPYRHPQSHGQPALRAERKLRLDVDRMLRDMAFVLKMTQRVKADILAKNSSTESLAV